jgi:hypothetical protein
MKIVRRYLSRYRKGRDRPDKEIDLANVTLQVLQGIFGEPETEQMYAVYTVKPQHVAALRPYVSEVFDFKRFDYFLEAEQT